MKKGDIIVCSTNRTSTTEYNLVVGDRYEIILVVGDKYEIIADPLHCFIPPPAWDWNTNPNDFSKIVLNVKNIQTGQEHACVPARIFITLDVYREFKLKQILN